VSQARIVVERSGAVAHARLNRPGVLNAIDGPTCDELIALVDGLEADPAVSVLLLSGAGERAFCSGADLGYMRSLTDDESLRRFIEKTWTAFDRLARSALPSLALLHGYVLGGGAELALACDLRIAERTLAFGFPEMGLGSVPGSGALQRLGPLVGPARTLELVTLGRRLDGEEALAMGLLNHLVDAGQGLTLAMEWAGELAKRPREALRYAKIGTRVGTDAVIAGAYHGLVSASLHAGRGYQQNTDRFKKPPHGSGGPR